MRVRDIKYIHATTGGHLEIVTSRGRVSIASSLKHFEDRFSKLGLIRIHRSYMVNMNWINAFDQRYIYSEKYQIPIGITYREKFMHQLKVIT